MEIQTNSTKGSALALAVIALAVGVLCIFGAYYLNSHPDVLEGIVGVVAAILMVIFAIFLIAMFVYVIAAFFFYATKGEEIQTDGDYSLDDIEPVKESSSEEERK